MCGRTLEFRFSNQSRYVYADIIRLTLFRRCTDPTGGGTSLLLRASVESARRLHLYFSKDEKSLYFNGGASARDRTKSSF